MSRRGSFPARNPRCDSGRGEVSGPPPDGGRSMRRTSESRFFAVVTRAFSMRRKTLQKYALSGSDFRRRTSPNSASTRESGRRASGCGVCHNRQ